MKKLPVLTCKNNHALINKAIALAHYKLDPSEYLHRYITTC